jgi:hypothetical protein
MIMKRYEVVVKVVELVDADSERDAIRQAEAKVQDAGFALGNVADVTEIDTWVAP